MTLAITFVPHPMQGDQEMAISGGFRLISHRFPMFPGGSLYDSAIHTLGAEKGRIVSRRGRGVRREAGCWECTISAMTLAMTFVPHPKQGNQEMATLGDFRLISHRFPMFPGGSLHDSAICTLGAEKCHIVSRGGRGVREARR